MDQVYPVQCLQSRSSVMTALRTVDRGTKTDYATICRATWDDADRILNQFGERLFNVSMIMRRIVLESSTIKKRMLIS
jgi:hypothetical protein